MNPLRLKKNEDRRLRGGHAWIFSNEVDTEQTPLKGFSPGELVQVEDSRGQALGIAYVNPDTLICARLLSRHCNTSIDKGFFRQRLETALKLRERLFDRPHYRLVFSESDGLPGLVVDRFGEVVVLQTNTRGMEQLQPLVIEALDQLLSPQAIVVKNTSSLRQLEGLTDDIRVAKGELPDALIAEENGARFRIDIMAGQKTGWFFDHRPNRALAAQLSKGGGMLDLFSYSGAWGIQAALAGASAVECVDGSEAALQLAKENADLNRVGERVTCTKADVFDFLKLAREERRRYQTIVLDPPALIKRKKDVKSGIEAYHRLNQGALQLLAPGGMLISASCSYHLQRETLQEILRSTSRHLDRNLVFIAQRGQGADHPVHPSIPETDYLKAIFCAVSLCA